MSPNPASSTLSLSISDGSEKAKDDDEFEFTITDMLGNVQKVQKSKTKENQLDISSLKSGNYSMRVLKGTAVAKQTFSVAK